MHLPKVHIFYIYWINIYNIYTEVHIYWYTLWRRRPYFWKIQENRLLDMLHITRIYDRILRYFGHIMQREANRFWQLTSKTGRPSTSWLDRVRNVTGSAFHKPSHRALDRKQWRNIIHKGLFILFPLANEFSLLGSSLKTLRTIVDVIWITIKTKGRILK